MSKKFRFSLPKTDAALVNEWARLNNARTQGRWSIEDMEFPEGDPDREFLEFVSEHTSRLLAIMADCYVVEGVPWQLSSSQLLL